MTTKPASSSHPDSPARRRLLGRFAASATLAYAAPTLVQLSQARASNGSGGSGGSGGGSGRSGAAPSAARSAPTEYR